MSFPIVLTSQLRPSAAVDPDSDDDVVSSGRPGRSNSISLSLRELKQLELSIQRNGPSGGLPLDCDCDSCPQCIEKRRRRRNNRDPHPSLRDFSIPAEMGGDSPSAEYLRAAAVPSKPVPSDHPLIVISLDGVVDARLPRHLSGGWTDVLSRPYLTTFMDYLLSRQSPWCIVFFSSLSRKKALKTMKALKLPTGGPEKDERDGVVGLFARDDMRGWNGGELEIKDLQVMWDGLEDEEGIRWGPEDTVVLTDFPGSMKKQPKNFILVPSLRYKSPVRPRDDLFLLLMIAVLKDLETESNFAYHIQKMDWSSDHIWTSQDQDSVNERNSYLFNAVRICADYRLSITAFTGN